MLSSPIFLFQIGSPSFCRRNPFCSADPSLSFLSFGPTASSEAIPSKPSGSSCWEQLQGNSFNGPSRPLGSENALSGATFLNPLWVVRTGEIGNKQTGVMGYTSRPDALDKGRLPRRPPNLHHRMLQTQFCSSECEFAHDWSHLRFLSSGPAEERDGERRFVIP